MASIQKRGNSYRITVSNGYDVNGRKLFVTATYTPDPDLSPSKQEKAVQAYAADFERQVKLGYSMDGRKITLKAFSDRWLLEYAAPNLQPSTLIKYKEELRDKILPALGHLKLADIKPHRVNSFFVSLTKNGVRRDGKPGGYSKGSIRKTRNVLSSVLRTAAEWELIDSNPCDKVRLQIESAADKITFFTPEQTMRFLDFIEQPYTQHIGGHIRTDTNGNDALTEGYDRDLFLSEQFRVLFNLAIYTGLRKGELLALQWSDIDFEGCLIHVSKSVMRVEGKTEVKAPKTRTSHRTVSIPAFLAERLHSLWEHQEEFRRQVGNFWQGDGWVFTQENGIIMHPSTPYETLRKTITRYNAKRQFDLRTRPPRGAFPLDGLAVCVDFCCCFISPRRNGAGLQPPALWWRCPAGRGLSPWCR